MKYKIVYSQDFEGFQVEIESWLEAGWKTLGPPSITVEEYMKLVEGGREYFQATTWRFHQALVKDD